MILSAIFAVSTLDPMTAAYLKAHPVSHTTVQTPGFDQPESCTDFSGYWEGRCKFVVNGQPDNIPMTLILEQDECRSIQFFGAPRAYALQSVTTVQSDAKWRLREEYTLRWLGDQSVKLTGDANSYLFPGTLVSDNSHEYLLTKRSDGKILFDSRSQTKLKSDDGSGEINVESSCLLEFVGKRR